MKTAGSGSICCFHYWFVFSNNSKLPKFISKSFLSTCAALTTEGRCHCKKVFSATLLLTLSALRFSEVIEAAFDIGTEREMTASAFNLIEIMDNTVQHEGGFQLYI